MSEVELPTLPIPPSATSTLRRDAGWLRSARRARWLSYFSLVWMMAEGVVGLVAGAEAHSIGVIAWAIGSAVEAAAAVIVIVRFTGQNRFSDTAEQRAQKWVAGSFFVLIPYILYESVSRLIAGSDPHRNWLAVGLLVSSIVLMPTLGWAKLRLGSRLGSGATAGEGTQNLLCALQGAVGLIGLLLGSAGVGFLDPVAALVIAGIAAKEGAELWHGDDCSCHSMPGLETPRAGCGDEGSACC
ncbi:cation transporter [Conexibacter sp. DBS9H8]|uniref:cation transporter n=1 Tax=Conexibacter sp. DBS9H8 TaxID=2937801 RepID=UPI00200F539E|nr:cation transporter [Conexibacter sp. DBS9H8]